jgi:tRNA (mo5U34)-methyltransferase
MLPAVVNSHTGGEPVEGRGGSAGVSGLKEEISHMGPWHLDVQVTPEVSTKAILEAPAEGSEQVSFVDVRPGWVEKMRAIYPDGLQGRSLLECACNCGAYSFWAKEMGAGETFGFDVRQHWIDQAHFLQQNRTVGPTDGMHFEIMDLYDLPKRGLEPFDITMFKGIFYHLPDPITGLKAAADLTKELLIFDTAIRTDLPDGTLAVAREGQDPVMTGVYGLNWFPTGPKVVAKILRWMGFVDVRMGYWRTRVGGRRPELGRLEMFASRREGLLDAFAPGFSEKQTVGLQEIHHASGTVTGELQNKRGFLLKPGGGGPELKLRVNRNRTRVKLGGEDAGPEAIEEGRRAEVAYVVREDKGGRMVARSVDILP